MKNLIFATAFSLISFALNAQCQSATKSDSANKETTSIAVVAESVLEKPTEATVKEVQLTNSEAVLVQNTEGGKMAASTVVVENRPTQTVQTVADHADFDALLAKHVSASGKVNYKNIKAEKAALNTYIEWLQNNVPADDAPKNQRMAFWINAYNALTIKLIVENYPLSKITNLDGGKTWDVKRNKLGNKKLSLNDIENTVLRPMGDARIHFAINCAAKSCPPLLNKAFTADNLEELLESRTKTFINSSANTLKTNEIKVSKIFDWYGKDFNGVATFVAKYAKTKVSKNAAVSFQDYDWNLNE